MRRILIVLAGVVGGIVLVCGVYLLWYVTRPQPQPIAQQAVFQGITYTRDVRQEPRPLVVHVAAVDLTAPDVEFLVTPKDDIYRFNYAARTASEFVEAYEVQLAINGDFFDPWYSRTPWDYYPRSGDGVNARGVTATNGRIVTYGYVEVDPAYTLFITEDNQAAVGEESEPIYHAISGNIVMLQDGEVMPIGDAPYLIDPHPRTAAGLTADGETLLLLVVDGRQPNYSEGVSIAELAAIAQEHGAYTALNLDGGGSTTMVIREPDGETTVLNSPIHTRLPGRERPVANHLGVYAPAVE